MCRGASSGKVTFGQLRCELGRGGPELVKFGQDSSPGCIPPPTCAGKHSPTSFRTDCSPTWRPLHMRRTQRRPAPIVLRAVQDLDHQVVDLLLPSHLHAHELWGDPFGTCGWAALQRAVKMGLGRKVHRPEVGKHMAGARLAKFGFGRASARYRHPVAPEPKCGGVGPSCRFPHHGAGSADVRPKPNLADDGDLVEPNLAVVFGRIPARQRQRVMKQAHAGWSPTRRPTPCRTRMRRKEIGGAAEAGAPRGDKETDEATHHETSGARDGAAGMREAEPHE